VYIGGTLRVVLKRTSVSKLTARNPCGSITIGSRAVPSTSPAMPAFGTRRSNTDDISVGKAWQAKLIKKNCLVRRPRSLSRIGPSAKTPDNCRLEVIRSEQLIDDDPGDMCAAATLSVPWVAPPSASTRFFGKGINGLRNGLGDHTAISFQRKSGRTKRTRSNV
jgi:hypothetical protein